MLNASLHQISLGFSYLSGTARKARTPSILNLNIPEAEEGFGHCLACGMIEGHTTCSDTPPQPRDGPFIQVTAPAVRLRSHSAIREPKNFSRGLDAIPRCSKLLYRDIDQDNPVRQLGLGPQASLAANLLETQKSRPHHGSI